MRPGLSRNARRFAEIVLELRFEHAVIAAHLLLLAQLTAVFGNLRPRLSAGRFLTGCGAAALDRAIARQAAIAFEKELNLFAGLAGGGFATAKTADGTGIARPLALHPSPFGRTAAVIRNRRHVFDHRDLQTGGLQRTDRGLASGAGALDQALRSTSCRVPLPCEPQLPRPSARRRASTSSIP